MKKRKVISILGACMISMMTFVSICFADEQTSVSYTPGYDAIASTQIKIIISSKMYEFGKIYDDDNNLVQDAAVYEIKYGQIKVFKIQPTMGYDVEKIIYDGKDITGNIRAMRSIQKEYFVEIVGLGYDTELKVTYKKIDGDINDGASKPDAPLDPDISGNFDAISKVPNTGDEMNLYKYITIAGISMVVIIATLLIKRKKNDEKI